MGFEILRRNGRLLARGAAIAVVCGAAAGCSSTSSRFGGLDGMFTASTPKADVTQAAAPLPAAPSGSITRASLNPAPQASPVSHSDLPPPTRAPAAVEQPAPRSAARDTLPRDGAQVTVQSGDTVYGLARRYGVPASRIMAANGLSPEDGLRSGRKIVIPGAAAELPAPKAEKRAEQRPAKEGKQELAATAPKPTHRSAETATAAAPTAKSDRLAAHAETAATKPQPAQTAQAAKPVGPAAAPAEAKPVRTAALEPPARAATDVVRESEAEDTDAAPDATGIGKMRWPVRGRVVSNFGSSGGKASDGIDIAVPEGTPVKAAENGVVIYAGDGLKEFGNTVLVRHEDGLVTVYGHASALKVARGEKVKRGQEIAVSGMSGQTDSPKLHFEVRKNSAPVDPKGFLE